MIRTGLLLNKSRALPLCRSFCQPRGKIYVIRTKSDDKKENQLEKVREQPKGIVGLVPWESLLKKAHKLLLKTQQQTSSMIRSLEIPERMTDIKKNQKAMLERNFAMVKEECKPENLKKLPGRAQEKWKIVKSSDGYKVAVNIPIQLWDFSKSTAAQAHRYWLIFLQSEFKAKLERFIIWLWVNGRNVGAKILKFIYEAYIEKSRWNPMKFKAILMKPKEGLMKTDEKLGESLKKPGEVGMKLEAILVKPEETLLKSEAVGMKPEEEQKKSEGISLKPEGVPMVPKEDPMKPKSSLKKTPKE